MKRSVVYLAALSLVISLFGVQGQQNSDPTDEYFPDIGDYSAMINRGDRINQWPSGFFMEPHAHRRRRMSTTTRKPKTG